MVDGLQQQLTAQMRRMRTLERDKGKLVEENQALQDAAKEAAETARAAEKALHDYRDAVSSLGLLVNLFDRRCALHPRDLSHTQQTW